MNVESIYNQARFLSEAERIELAAMLLSTVDSTDQAVREAWLAEIDRRRDQFSRGELQTIPYEAVMPAALPLRVRDES